MSAVPPVGKWPLLIRGHSGVRALFVDVIRRRCWWAQPKSSTGWRMSGRGVRADEARIVWAELMRFKRSFTDPVPKSQEQSFAKAGIAAFHGRARFVGSTVVEVGADVLE